MDKCKGLKGCTARALILINGGIQCSNCGMIEYYNVKNIEDEEEEKKRIELINQKKRKI